MHTYYNSYRESVIADALPGFAEFAKNTPTKSSQFENFSEYLTYVTNAITDNVNRNNKQGAMLWIREHQFAVKQLFEKMVEGYKNPLEYGWKSFKFSNVAIEFDKFIAVQTPKDFAPGKFNKPVIFGSELEALFKHPSKDLIAGKLLEIKSAGACYVHIGPTGFQKFELAYLNKQTVIDWTGVI